MTLTVTATRPRGYRGNIYLSVPKGFAFQNSDGLWIAKDGNDGMVIVRWPFDFSRGEHVMRTLKFIPDPSFQQGLAIRSDQ
jgi:hypothetical protein